jgi:hypothetical protein
MTPKTWKACAIRNCNSVASAVTFVAVVTLSGLASAQTPSQRDTGRVLTLCELKKNWKQYTQRVVTVRAIYTEEVVQERLYDPTCPQFGEIAIRWSHDVRTDATSAAGKLHRIATDDDRKRARVTAEGIFRGPERLSDSDIPDNLPDWAKDRMRTSHHTYGYMNGLDSQLEVTKIRKSERVPGSVPGRSR